MKSIKAQLLLALALSLLVMLAMGSYVYLGARNIEANARSTRDANDEMRELLGFALSAHRYINAVGQSLGQRTLVANNERRLAAEDFEQRIATLSTPNDRSVTALPWNDLRTASSSLSGALHVAAEQRAEGNFLEAERVFSRARKAHFDQEMLPWFQAAIEAKRREVEATEARAVAQARELRLGGTTVAGAAAALVTLVLLTTLGALAKPLRLLVAGTEAIAQGDYSHRIKDPGSTELGALAARFNDMAAVVQKSREELLEQHRALEEAYDLQGQFLSVVSHELRSPLNSIIGYTELVLDDAQGLDEANKKNVDNIAGGARRLLGLINDILDFSKLRAGHMTARVSKFSVSELLRVVLDDTRALVGGRPLNVSLELAPDVGEMLSDDVKVRQVLTNLTSNAIKFTESGSVVISVASADDVLRFKVKDTGIGIARSQLGAIFEPFRQARGTGRRAVGGTGLGLAIVARTTELLGGKVAVQSQPGTGSEFTVELPRVLPKIDGEHSHY
ncbi:MAG: HAMP domain-containing sensor histidine kinase [Polyangiaceae bacterium]